MNQPICFIINAGALGDCVATLPAIKYAIDNIWTDGKYHIVVKPYFRPLFFFVPDDKISSIDDPVNFTEPYSFVKLNDFQMTDVGPASLPGVPAPMKLNLVDYASIKLLGQVLEDKAYPQLPTDHIDITKFNLPKNYACIVSNGIHKARSIPDAELDKIALGLIERGLTPVYIGKTEREIECAGAPNTYGDKTKIIAGAIDLIDKTTLMEATAVMANAKYILGTDAGLIHLAGMTKTQIICGYTTLNPNIRLPNSETIAVVPESGCKFCQSSWYISNHDFNNCYTQTYECAKKMTADKFLKEITKIGE